MSKPFRILTSLVTLLSFLVTQTFLPFPLFAEATFPLEVKVSPGFQLNLPAELGTIESIHSGAGPVLIHIQTAHGNYEAQKKIQAILHHLKESYGIKTLFVEGSALKLRPEILRLFPQEMDLTMEIADDLTKKAWVKGSELFLLEAREAGAYGIENLESYRDNIDAFRAVLTEQNKTAQFLRDMNIQIERLTSPYLNKDLRAFLKRLDFFDVGAGLVPAQGRPQGSPLLLEHLSYLKTQAQKHLEIDLADAAYQIDWPMLVRIFKLNEFESKIRMADYGKERDEFLKAIRRFLVGAATGSRPDSTVYHQIQSLLSSPLSQRQLPDPETELFFEAMVKALPKNFNYEKYPNVKIFIGHLLLQSELKAHLLMEEIDKLAEKIARRLAVTPEEKRILTLLASHSLLKKLFALELTPADYEAISPSPLPLPQFGGEDKGEGVNASSESNNILGPRELIQAFLELNETKRVRGVKFEHIGEIESLFAKALEFYRIVKERDRWMTENIAKQFKENKFNKAVVITGGFHAEPFKQFFEAKGFNYALISPKITTTDGREAYLRTILQTQVKALETSTVESTYPLALSRSEVRAHGMNPDLVVPDVLASAQQALARRGRGITGGELKRKLAPTRFAQGFRGIRKAASGIIRNDVSDGAAVQASPKILRNRLLGQRKSLPQTPSIGLGYSSKVSPFLSIQEHNPNIQSEKKYTPESKNRPKKSFGAENISGQKSRGIHRNEIRENLGRIFPLLFGQSKHESKGTGDLFKSQIENDIKLSSQFPRSEVRAKKGETKRPEKAKERTQQNKVAAKLGQVDSGLAKVIVWLGHSSFDDIRNPSLVDRTHVKAYIEALEGPSPNYRDLAIRLASTRKAIQGRIAKIDRYLSAETDVVKVTRGYTTLFTQRETVLRFEGQLKNSVTVLRAMERHLSAAIEDLKSLRSETRAKEVTEELIRKFEGYRKTEDWRAFLSELMQDTSTSAGGLAEVTGYSRAEVKKWLEGRQKPDETASSWVRGHFERAYQKDSRREEVFNLFNELFMPEKLGRKEKDHRSTRDDPSLKLIRKFGKRVEGLSLEEAAIYLAEKAPGYLKRDIRPDSIKRYLLSHKQLMQKYGIQHSAPKFGSRVRGAKKLRRSEVRTGATSLRSPEGEARSLKGNLLPSPVALQAEFLPRSEARRMSALRTSWKPEARSQKEKESDSLLASRFVPQASSSRSEVRHQSEEEKEAEIQKAPEEIRRPARLLVALLEEHGIEAAVLASLGLIREGVAVPVTWPIRSGVQGFGILKIREVNQPVRYRVVVHGGRKGISFDETVEDADQLIELTRRAFFESLSDLPRGAPDFTSAPVPNDLLLEQILAAARELQEAVQTDNWERLEKAVGLLSAGTGPTALTGQFVKYAQKLVRELRHLPPEDQVRREQLNADTGRVGQVYQQLVEFSSQAAAFTHAWDLRLTRRIFGIVTYLNLQIPKAARGSARSELRAFQVEVEEAAGQSFFARKFNFHVAVRYGDFASEPFLVANTEELRDGLNRFAKDLRELQESPLYDTKVLPPFEAKLGEKDDVLVSFTNYPRIPNDLPLGFGLSSAEQLQQDLKRILLRTLEREIQRLETQLREVKTQLDWARRDKGLWDYLLYAPPLVYRASADELKGNVERQSALEIKIENLRDNIRQLESRLQLLTGQQPQVRSEVRARKSNQSPATSYQKLTRVTGNRLLVTGDEVADSRSEVRAEEWPEGIAPEQRQTLERFLNALPGEEFAQDRQDIKRIFLWRLGFRKGDSPTRQSGLADMDHQVAELTGQSPLPDIHLILSKLAVLSAAERERIIAEAQAEKARYEVIRLPYQVKGQTEQREAKVLIPRKVFDYFSHDSEAEDRILKFIKEILWHGFEGKKFIIDGDEEKEEPLAADDLWIAIEHDHENPDRKYEVFPSTFNYESIRNGEIRDLVLQLVEAGYDEISLDGIRQAIEDGDLGKGELIPLLITILKEGLKEKQEFNQRHPQSRASFIIELSRPITQADLNAVSEALAGDSAALSQLEAVGDELWVVFKQGSQVLEKRKWVLGKRSFQPGQQSRSELRRQVTQQPQDARQPLAMAEQFVRQADSPDLVLTPEKLLIIRLFRGGLLPFLLFEALSKGKGVVELVKVVSQVLGRSAFAQELVEAGPEQGYLNEILGAASIPVITDRVIPALPQTVSRILVSETKGIINLDEAVLREFAQSPRALFFLLLGAARLRPSGQPLFQVVIEKGKSAQFKEDLAAALTAQETDFGAELALIAEEKLLDLLYSEKAIRFIEVEDGKTVEEVRRSLIQEYKGGVVVWHSDASVIPQGLERVPHFSIGRHKVQKNDLIALVLAALLTRQLADQIKSLIQAVPSKIGAERLKEEIELFVHRTLPGFKRNEGGIVTLDNLSQFITFAHQVAQYLGSRA